MKIFNTLIFTFLVTFFTNAQKPTIKFGNVSLEELKKSKYDIDTTADAVVLYEKAEIIIGYDDYSGFYLETDFIFRKKILKTSGLDNGIIKISYYQGSSKMTQMINNLKGNTYNIVDGKIVKTELSNKTNKNEKISGDNYEKTINLPNVNEGSIIEYKYTFRSPINLVHNPDTWTFQGSIPKLWSELQFSIPSYLQYKQIYGGYLPIDVNLQENIDIKVGRAEDKLDTYGIKYIYGIKNVPAFSTEEFITTKKDYVSKIEFELTQASLPYQIVQNFSLDYGSLDKTLIDSDNFGKKIKRKGYLKDVANNFSAIKTKKEQLEKVYAFMVDRFEVDLDQSGIFLDDLKKVFDNKKGSASELNMIMIALLKELDFEVNPVILSTRSHGKINEFYALLKAFNYTVCQVDLDGEKIYVDVTDKYGKLGMLPERCLNKTGRLLNNEGGQFIDLTPKDKYKEFENLDLVINPETSSITGKYQSSGSGYYGSTIRTQYY
jgi:hypothetical protein